MLTVLRRYWPEAVCALVASAAAVWGISLVPLPGDDEAGRKIHEWGVGMDPAYMRFFLSAGATGYASIGVFTLGAKLRAWAKRFGPRLADLLRRKAA